MFAKSARARVCVPYICWIFTSQIIKQHVTMINHLIFAQRVENFAPEMIPTANITLCFRLGLSGINKVYLICDYYDRENIYQAICLNVVHVQNLTF